MKGISIVKGGKFIEQAAHELHIFHGLAPVRILLYLRMLDFHDLQRGGYESQGITDFMRNRRYSSMVIF